MLDTYRFLHPAFSFVSSIVSLLLFISFFFFSCLYFVSCREVVSLAQWFLTFSKSGNTFDYMKNLRNGAKLMIQKNKQKHPA